MLFRAVNLVRRFSTTQIKCKAGIVVNDVDCGAVGPGLVEGKERLEACDHPQGVLPQNWGGTEQNRAVTCMVLKAMANDRRKNLTLRHDEFCRP
ncbi:hypothetical protein TNCV_341341 [Trichonephila clavipes]|nr:hypothetical protein TNCV_341341 [Trichonephila clavipes]